MRKKYHTINELRAACARRQRDYYRRRREEEARKRLNQIQPKDKEIEIEVE